jgi:hypothetical protein
MHKLIRGCSLAGSVLAVALIAAAPALAQQTAFKADLKGSNEVPPNNTTGTGSATVNYNPATKELSWRLTFSGLTGNATAAHFHGPAEPDKNAGVVVPIGAPPTSPAEGKATLTDAQAADLMAGRWYINVHTAAHPPGEIRGQVVK